MRPTPGEQREVCGQCGGDALRPATRREQLARWFVHGEGAGTAWLCARCGASWSGGAGYSVLYRAVGSGRRRWLRLPLDVLQAVRRARRWQPVPVLYAAVGAVAVVPAVAVGALTRVRWWVVLAGVPVAAMIVVFLWSLTTAVGRGGRRDVLWELAPDRAWRHQLEEDIAALRGQIGDFQLLAPDGWPGELSLDGASWSSSPRRQRVLQDVVVVADQGDPMLDPGRHRPGWRPATPRVEIHVGRDPWNDLEGAALEAFVERAVPASPRDLADVAQLDPLELERRLLAAHQEDEQVRRRWEAELVNRWRDGDMQVDGVAIPVRVLTHDDADVAIATFVRAGHPVMVIAEGIELGALSLMGVADPTPLLDGFEVRRRRMFTQEPV